MGARRPSLYWSVDSRPCLWEAGKLPLVLSDAGTTWERRYDLQYLSTHARPVSAARFRAMVARAATAGARIATTNAAGGKPTGQQRPAAKKSSRNASKTNRATRKSSRR